MGDKSLNVRLTALECEVKYLKGVVASLCEDVNKGDDDSDDSDDTEFVETL
jgi:hypothetical protein